MIQIIPVIIWDGLDAVSLGRTLKSVLEFPVVQLWTTDSYQNTHRVISSSIPGALDTDLQVFEVLYKMDFKKIRNQAIREANKEIPGTYVTFLKAGDIIRNISIANESDDSPIYLGTTIGEYKEDKKLYEVLEDSYPSSVAGLVLKASWLISEDLRFRDNTEFSFIREVFKKHGDQRLWTIDFTVEVAQNKKDLKSIIEYIKTLDPESDKDYYVCRHTLSRLILDALINGEDVSEYLEYAYLEKQI